MATILRGTLPGGKHQSAYAVPKDSPTPHPLPRFLSAVQQPNPATKQHGGTCAELVASVAADARAARQTNPGLRFYWGMAGPMATMVRVFNSTAMRATLVKDLANFTAQYSDVVHGFAFDYEVHYDTVPPDPHFCSRPDCFWHIKNGRTKST